MPSDPDPALAAPQRGAKELLARKNQLEVLLAQLERAAPQALQAAHDDTPAAVRARERWDQVRSQLLAVERELLRLGP